MEIRPHDKDSLGPVNKIFDKIDKIDAVDIELCKFKYRLDKNDQKYVN